LLVFELKVSHLLGRHLPLESCPTLVCLKLVIVEKCNWVWYEYNFYWLFITIPCLRISRT
jgi:hypothetical protein